MNTSICKNCDEQFLPAYVGQDVCSARCRSEHKKPKVKPRVDKRRFDPDAAPSYCEASECLNRAVHDHHVVQEQYVRRWEGDISDPRNKLKVCVQHHTSHTNHFKKLPTHCLREDNLQFAFELMGAAAADYLRRMYDDSTPDIRIERCLKKSSR